METLFVYGLVVLFFIGTVGLVFFVIAPNGAQLANQDQNSANARLDGQQNSVLNYGIVAALFLLFIVLTFATRKGQPVS